MFCFKIQKKFETGRASFFRSRIHQVSKYKLQVIQSSKMSKPTEFTEEEKSQRRAYLAWSMKLKLATIRAAVKKANVVLLEEGKVGNSGQLLFWAKENHVTMPDTSIIAYLATGAKHYSEERAAEAKKANKMKGMREWSQSEEAKAKKKELNAKGYARRKAEVAALKATVKDPFQGPVTVVPLNTLSIAMLDDLFGEESEGEVPYESLTEEECEPLLGV